MTVPVPANNGNVEEILDLMKGTPLFFSRKSLSGSHSQAASASLSNDASVRNLPYYRTTPDMRCEDSTTQAVSSSVPGFGTWTAGPSQEDNTSSDALHYDLLQWVAGLESGSSTDANMDQPWLQANEAAASTIFTESEMAASLAMLQSFTESSALFSTQPNAQFCPGTPSPPMMQLRPEPNPFTQ